MVQVRHWIDRGASDITRDIRIYLMIDLSKSMVAATPFFDKITLE